MVDGSAPAGQREVVDTECDNFLGAVQGMVGGGISAAKKQFGNAKKSTAQSVSSLFNKLTFKDDSSVAISSDYQQFYPASFQHTNSGGLHLIPPQFVPWAIELLEFIANSYRKENIVENRKEYIAVSLSKLRQDESIFDSFKQVVQLLQITIDSKLLAQIHLRIAEYAFRAFTKQKNNMEFNGVKELASDKTNINFRTVVQMGGPGAKEEVTAKQAQLNVDQVRKDLGQKPTSKRERSTEAEATLAFHEPYKRAIAILHQNDRDIQKLNRDQCAAVLTLGFGSFTRVSSKKKDALVALVRTAMTADYSGKARPDFFSKIEAEEKKEKADGVGRGAAAKAPSKKRKAARSAAGDGEAAKKKKQKQKGDDGADGGKKPKAKPKAKAKRKAKANSEGGDPKRKRGDPSDLDGKAAAS